MEVYNEYHLADMVARYVRDSQSGQVGLVLFPETMSAHVSQKQYRVDSLAQVKLVGDAYPGGFSHGHSMRNSESVSKLTLEDQFTIENHGNVTIVTVWQHPSSCRIEHRLIWECDYRTLESYTLVHNVGQTPITLEMVSSFSLTGLTPFEEGDAAESLVLHRILSSWSAEGRLTSSSVEDLQLEPSWAGHGVRTLRFGQVGSMPVRGYFPMAFLEDKRSGVTWGVGVAHPASWQIEASRRDAALSLSGGQADREFGHWSKRLGPGQSFQTPSSYLTTVKGDVDCAANRLTEIQNRPLMTGPAVEEDLPIVFNEYCTTWGAPSAANLHAIAERMKGKGIRYLVIDAGWYKNDETTWYNSMGDWQVSSTLYPDGLDQTLQHIRECGMIPGIWFEMEVCGSQSTVFHLVDHLLKRDGVPITVGDRRFWDFRDPFVIRYLSERVVSFLKRHGFGYLKVDYNDSLGIGCDGAESLGEGLRQQMEAVADFFRLIRQEIPDIVIENCASGGHRLEPSMLALTSMSSFSDAHECEEIPIIAANLHRTMLPRQSQIWAVLRKHDSLQRLVYSLAAAMLGRMCLSGDIHELSEDKWRVVDEAIGFYQHSTPIIKDGITQRFGSEIQSYRHPKGWQGMWRTTKDGANGLAVIHRFAESAEGNIEVPLGPASNYQIAHIFSDGHARVNVEANHLLCELENPFSAVCVLLRQGV